MLNVEQLTRETTTGYIRFTGLVIPQTWNCQLLPTLGEKCERKGQVAHSECLNHS